MRKFTCILTVVTLMILCTGCKHQKSVDDLPEAAFFMVGDIEQAKEKARKLKEENEDE